MRVPSEGGGIARDFRRIVKRGSEEAAARVEFLLDATGPWDCRLRARSCHGGGQPGGKKDGVPPPRMSGIWIKPSRAGANSGARAKQCAPCAQLYPFRMGLSMAEQTLKTRREPLLKELTGSRDANTAAASVGVKRDIAGTHGEKNAASLAKKWRKRESKRTKRVKPCFRSGSQAMFRLRKIRGLPFAAFRLFESPAVRHARRRQPSCFGPPSTSSFPTPARSRRGRGGILGRQGGELLSRDAGAWFEIDHYRRGAQG